MANFWDKKTPYENWIESTGAPIHRGYYIEDCRTVELGYWPARECDAAFIQLAGQEGVTGAYVTEIPPEKTLPTFRVAVDEVVYVLQGRGVASIWAGERPKRIFEWQSHSMFLIPGNYHSQLSNMQGDQSVKLLHCSYLPLAMSVLPDPEIFFKNPLVDYNVLYGGRPAISIQKRKWLLSTNPVRVTGEIFGSATFSPICERGIVSIISSAGAPGATWFGWDSRVRRCLPICRSSPRAPIKRPTVMGPVT
jgi:hypothetical protein